MSEPEVTAQHIEAARAVLTEQDSLPGLVRLTAMLGARRVPQEKEDEAMAAAPG